MSTDRAETGRLEPIEEAPHPTLAHLAKYDLEDLRSHYNVLKPGEPVVITEMIHGTHARYAWRDGGMWVGARSHWRRPVDDVRSDWWWGALAQSPWIEEWCRAHPDAVLFGEVFGAVQDLTYGAREGEYRFRAFDVFRPGRFLDPDAFLYALISMPIGVNAPVVYDGPLLLLDAIEEMSRGDSFFGGIAKGIVIKPLHGRSDPRIGRVALKLVSELYLERAK